MARYDKHNKKSRLAKERRLLLEVRIMQDLYPLLVLFAGWMAVDLLVL